MKTATSDPVTDDLVVQLLQETVMFNGIFTSLSGMLNASRRTNITANNIANMQTPGFKASRAENVEVQGGGVRIGSIVRDNTPGPPILEGPPGEFSEGSNVDIVSEQVNLLIDKRQFQANVNALKLQDETLGDLLDMID